MLTTVLTQDNRTTSSQIKTAAASIHRNIDHIITLLDNLIRKTLVLSAIDKNRLHAYDVTPIRNKEHVELKTPYLLCYDNGITTIEWFVKERLGSTARGMVIIDEKD